MRRHGTLTAALAAGLVVSGCGAHGDGSNDDSQTGGVTGTITVFAAASLTEVFSDIEERFERRNPGVDVVLSFGGSGALAAQILEGAPADVFAAADLTPMARVVDAGDAPASSVFATNTLHLVVPAGNPGGVTGLADLTASGLTIALCDPSVPCGAAAEQLLALAGLSASPDTLEQDVKAVLTKVALGEADAGLVYVTDVIAAGDSVEGIRVPDAHRVVNEYPIAVLTGAPNPAGATAFVEFVLTGAGASTIADAGFGTP